MFGPCLEASCLVLVFRGIVFCPCLEVSCLLLVLEVS